MRFCPRWLRERRQVVKAGVFSNQKRLLPEQVSCKRREPGDSAVAPWNVAQLSQIGDGAHGPSVTVVDKVPLPPLLLLHV